MTQADRPLVVVLNDVAPGYYATFPHALDELRLRADVQVHTDEAGSDGDLVERLAAAWAAIDIRGWSRFDASLLAHLPRLRVIAVRGTTAPLIDLSAASQLGVLVCNTPFQSTQAVSEFTLGLIFAAVRRIPQMHARLRQGQWQEERGFVIGGKTLGVIGLGMIGQAVARLGCAVGMRVLVWSPTSDSERAAACGGKLVDLDTLLRTADVVSLHLRLSDTTRGIIGRRELALLKDGAIFVNTARAGLTYEGALVDELRRGRIFAALDVFDREPLPPDHPLLGLENVILTPHAGWATHEVAEQRARLPVANVLAALDGRPQNVMNPDVVRHPNWKRILG